MQETVEHWKVVTIPRGIQVTCRGHDKSGTAPRAVAEFLALAKAHRGEFVMVADLREMTGYESESRVVWQNAFRECRSRLRGLIFLGARSALIRMGAAAVGAFAAIPVRFVSAWSEVERAIDEIGP